MDSADEGWQLCQPRRSRKIKLKHTKPGPERVTTSQSPSKPKIYNYRDAVVKGVNAKLEDDSAGVKLNEESEPADLEAIKQYRCLNRLLDISCTMKMSGNQTLELLEILEEYREKIEMVA